MLAGLFDGTNQLISPTICKVLQYFALCLDENTILQHNIIPGELFAGEFMNLKCIVHWQIIHGISETM